jgi:hypothetical protein
MGMQQYFYRIRMRQLERKQTKHSQLLVILSFPYGLRSSITTHSVPTHSL